MTLHIDVKRQFLSAAALAMVLCDVVASSTPASSQGSMPGFKSIIPGEVNCITQYVKDPLKHYTNYLRRSALQNIPTTSTLACSPVPHTLAASKSKTSELQ